jgi:hypothetical protein
MKTWNILIQSLAKAGYDFSVDVMSHFKPQEDITSLGTPPPQPTSSI